MMLLADNVASIIGRGITQAAQVAGKAAAGPLDDVDRMGDLADLVPNRPTTQAPAPRVYAGIGEYVGGYSDWVRQRPDPRPVPKVKAAPRPATAAPNPPRKRKLSFKEAQELEALPDRIDALERERDALYASLSDAGRRFADASSDRASLSDTRAAPAPSGGSKYDRGSPTGLRALRLSLQGSAGPVPSRRTLTHQGTWRRARPAGPGLWACFGNPGTR